MNFFIKKYILYFPIQHNLLKNLLYNFTGKSLKNFIFYFFFFYFLFSIFSLFLTTRISLQTLFTSCANLHKNQVGKFCRHSNFPRTTWSKMEPKWIESRIIVWNIRLLLIIYFHPSDQKFFYPFSSFLSLSFFFHVIFFPLSSLHRVAIQMQERAVRWQQRTVQWRERLFRPFRRVKLPWVSENFIPFYYSGIIILDNYFLNPFHWVYT